LSSYALSTKVI